jgi:hypothetical protein
VEYYFSPELDAALAQEGIDLNDTTLHEDTALVDISAARPAVAGAHLRAAACRQRGAGGALSGKW